MDLRKAFETSVERSRSLKKLPSNENLFKMYGLFKQATEGDVNTERPGGFDFKAIAKYDAWASHKGKPQAVAMQEYIDLIDSLFLEQDR